MNPHQNSEIKNIQKVCICSHDRLNENDDTSNFNVELGQQVKDISEFKLVSAMVPLSSYTFNVDDDDKTFQISTVEGATRIRNNTLVSQFMNFKYHTPPPLFGYGTINPSEQLRVRIDGLYTQKVTPFSDGSIALRLFNSVSEAANASYINWFTLNSTINYEQIATNLTNFCAAQTSLEGFKLDGLRFKDNWVTPFATNTDAKNEVGAQTIFSHPDVDYDTGRDVIYVYNKNANQDFTVNIGWYYYNALTSKYDIPIDKATISVQMNSISTKLSIGTYIFGIRPPNPWSNYDAETIGFQTNTVYTNATLVTWLNSQVAFNRFGITFSKVQVGDNVGLDKLSITSTPNTGYRRIDPVNGNVTIFRRLGFRYKSVGPTVLFKVTDSVGAWENLNIPVPLEPINIYYEIRCNNVIQILTGTNLWSDLIKQGSFIGTIAESGTGEADYPALKINLEIVKDPNSPNLPNYYSIKMSSPDPNCNRLEMRLDDSYRPFFIPTNGDYYYRLSGPVAPEPTPTSTVASGLIFQPFITNIVQTLAEKKVWWPNPYADTITISYKTDTVYTESQLLSDTQVITVLTPNLIFSIVEHKLKIQNTSETTAYLLSANERLGIPYDAILQPLSTYTAIELIDVSSLNDVIYISLPDLYQDGKNSYNSFKSLTSDPTHQRPIISSIVCSIANNADVQYGKYVSYNNQADSWMRSTRKDLKTLKIQILDSEYRILDLNKKAVHLELDFR